MEKEKGEIRRQHWAPRSFNSTAAADAAAWPDIHLLGGGFSFLGGGGGGCLTTHQAPHQGLFLFTSSSPFIPPVT